MPMWHEQHVKSAWCLGASAGRMRKLTKQIITFAFPAPSTLPMGSKKRTRLHGLAHRPSLSRSQSQPCVSDKSPMIKNGLPSTTVKASLTPHFRYTTSNIVSSAWRSYNSSRFFAGTTHQDQKYFPNAQRRLHGFKPLPSALRAGSQGRSRHRLGLSPRYWFSASSAFATFSISGSTSFGSSVSNGSTGPVFATPASATA